MDGIDRRTGGERAAVASGGGLWTWLRPALGLAFGVLATLGVVRLYPTAFVPVDQIVQERGALPASYVGLLTDKDGVPTVLASSTRHGTRMTLKILRPIEVPPGKVLQMWALPREGAPFPLGTIPHRDKGEFTMSDTSEKLRRTCRAWPVSRHSRTGLRPPATHRRPSSSPGIA